MSSFARLVSAIDLLTPTEQVAEPVVLPAESTWSRRQSCASTSISASLSFQFFGCVPCCEVQVHHLCQRTLWARDDLAAPGQIARANLRPPCRVAVHRMIQLLNRRFIFLSFWVGNLLPPLA